MSALFDGVTQQGVVRRVLDKFGKLMWVCTPVKDGSTQHTSRSETFEGKGRKVQE